jgi:hypothetical protein
MPLFDQSTPRRQLPRPQLRLGQSVHVNAHAAWLPATVVSIAHTAIGINLQTVTPVTRTVAPWVVQPAEGLRLEPVHRLRHGDQVVDAAGNSSTVAAPPWQGRDGWWVITYTNGVQAILPAGAILRLRDDTPAVTVNGAPVRNR